MLIRKPFSLSLRLKNNDKRDKMVSILFAFVPDNGNEYMYMVKENKN